MKNKIEKVLNRADDNDWGAIIHKENVMVIEEFNAYWFRSLKNFVRNEGQRRKELYWNKFE